MDDGRRVMDVVWVDCDGEHTLQIYFMSRRSFQQCTDLHPPKILPLRTTDGERNTGRIVCFCGQFFFSNGQGLSTHKYVGMRNIQ